MTEEEAIALLKLMGIYNFEHRLYPRGFELHIRELQTNNPELYYRWSGVSGTVSSKYKTYSAVQMLRFMRSLMDDE